MGLARVCCGFRAGLMLVWAGCLEGGLKVRLRLRLRLVEGFLGLGQLGLFGLCPLSTVQKQLSQGSPHKRGAKQTVVELSLQTYVTELPNLAMQLYAAVKQFNES